MKKLFSEIPYLQTERITLREVSHLYDECFRESLILGIYLDDEFCGLAEMYGYRKEIHKISVGYRLMEKHWGYESPTIADKWIR